MKTKDLFVIRLKFTLLILFLLLPICRAEEIVPGKNPKDYSIDELKMRVWKLEKAFQNLSQRPKKKSTVKKLEVVKKPQQWNCSIETGLKTFTSRHKKKREAKDNVINDCRGIIKDFFACMNPKCHWAN